MADNIDITPGAGKQVATDDIGGVHYQRVKIAIGIDGTAIDLAPGQALAAASLPVVLTAIQLTALAQETGNLGTIATNTGRLPTLVTGRLPVDGSGVTQPVSGTVTVNALPTGTNSVGQVTANAGANLNTSSLALEAGGNLTSIASNTGRLPAQGQALATASLPVVLTAVQMTTLTPPANVGITGTVAVSAASLPLPSGSSTSVKQSDGTQKTQVVDGAGNVIGSTANALDVNIKSGGGGGGGGFQYVEDAASAGNETMTLAGAIRQDTLASTTSADGDYANLKTDSVGRLYSRTSIDTALPTGTNSVGQITANAGTNLNTSLLALEAGGNLASVASSNTTIASNTGRLPAQGQALASASLPVVLTAVQLSSLIASVADVSASGTVNAATLNAAVTVAPSGHGTAAFSVAGLTGTGATLTIEASDDAGVTYQTVNGVAPATGLLLTTLTTDQQFRVNAAGRTRIRLRVSAVGTGTATVASNLSVATGIVGLGASLPAGANQIGTIGIRDGAGNAITSAARGSERAVSVQIVDAAGVQVTSFGGGGGSAAGGSFTASFTRPADVVAYGGGDVVSNNVTTTTMMTFTNVVSANGKGAYVVGVRLITDKKSVTPRFRVHLFSDNTATVSGDNLPWREVYADSSKRLGYFDLPAMATGADVTNSDMSRTLDNSVRHRVQCGAASRSVFAVLETLDAFTPASGEGFTLVLLVDGES